MFGKDKVKGHNRIIKGKSGFKVAHIRDFLRKKDDSKKRNLAIGTAAVIGAGGIALLLRKKGVKFPGNVGKKASDMVVDVKSRKVYVSPEPIKNVVNKEATKAVVDDFSNALEQLRIKTKAKARSVTQNTDEINELERRIKESRDILNKRKSESIIKDNSPEKYGTDKTSIRFVPNGSKRFTSKTLKRNSGIRKKVKSSNIPDPWKTPIITKLDDVSEMVVKPKSKGTKLLTGKKVPDSRGNLYGYDNRVSRRVAKRAASDANRIVEMEKTYNSISPDNLAMKASIKIDHYLKRPRKTSNLGAPPKPTSLEEVIKNPNVKQAQKKVEDRLARAERQVNKKTKTLKKN